MISSSDSRILNSKSTNFFTYVSQVKKIKKENKFLMAFFSSVFPIKIKYILRNISWKEFTDSESIIMDFLK